MTLQQFNMNTERLFKLNEFILIKNDETSELEMEKGQIVKIMEEDFHTIPEEQLYCVRIMHEYNRKNKNTNDNIFITTANNLIPYYPHHDVDFSFIKNNESKLLISTAYSSLNIDEWKMIRDFKGESFIFSEDKEINNLMKKIDDTYQGHSGSSIGWTMRQLERIAYTGYHKFKDEWIKYEREREREREKEKEKEK